VHEEIDVRDDVLRPEPEGGERHPEVGPAARGVLHAVADLVALGAAATADRVVSATRVLHDREQAAAPIRVDAVTAREEDRLRVLHRVRRVVAFLRVRGVVTEEVHSLLALQSGITRAHHCPGGITRSSTTLAAGPLPRPIGAEYSRPPRARPSLDSAGECEDDRASSSSRSSVFGTSAGSGAPWS